MSPSFDYAPNKEGNKSSQLEQPDPYITNNQYEETFLQRKGHIIPGRRTYLESNLQRNFASSVIAT